MAILVVIFNNVVGFYFLHTITSIYYFFEHLDNSHSLWMRLNLIVILHFPLEFWIFFFMCCWPLTFLILKTVCWESLCFTSPNIVRLSFLSFPSFGLLLDTLTKHSLAPFCKISLWSCRLFPLLCRNFSVS